MQAPAADSYWLSSLELRVGVEVKAVGVRAVPTEALREFLRMREAWRQHGRTAEAAAHEEPAVPSAFELDIALDADGRVTLPGDLLPAGR